MSSVQARRRRFQPMPLNHYHLQCCPFLRTRGQAFLTFPIVVQVALALPSIRSVPELKTREERNLLCQRRLSSIESVFDPREAATLPQSALDVGAPQLVQ